MQIPSVKSDSAVAASGRRWTYRGLIALVVFGALAFVGWHWRSGVRVSRVEIRESCWITSTPGCIAVKADSLALVELVGIEPGTLLYSIDPAVVADRVSAHPWVASADIKRTPGGKLIVEVAPREPRLMVMRHGRPAYYVDKDGYKMPLVTGVAFDVPLVNGLNEAYEPREPIGNQAVLRLAEMIGDLEPEIDALISEIDFDGDNEIVIHTTPAGTLPSLEVVARLERLEDQLAELRAYWDQVLLATSSTDIRQIDLRFDSRIITR